ncbi:MAG: excinuclease ABC subunit UvrC [Eubacteriaceae bacterium]|jgi:excinuclease ABC subunit C|nr:excinuclease ABC subunit UvrC [Eubacteriaceae bacterium]
MYTRQNLSELPEKPGIYMMKNNSGDIIYVGKAINLKNRVRQYFQTAKNLTPKTAVLVSHIQSIETIVVDSEMEALILECNLIKEHRPRYNVLLKDDKSYPSIKMTLGENYPRILMTRDIQKDGSKYFGPFTNSFAVKKTIEAIQKTYPLRRCNRPLAYGKKVGRPCLNFHIGQCNAPCRGNVPPEDYHESVQAVMEILNGKEEALLANIRERMHRASEALDFELAAKLRDQIYGIEHIVQRQKMITSIQQDEDVIAYASRGDLVSVQVFNIREGKMLGRDHAFLEGAEELSPEDILTVFIKQYYAQRPYIPKEILLPHELNEEKKVIEDWLCTLRDGRVKFVVPLRGRRKKLLDLVAKNAALTLDQYELEKEQKRQKRQSKMDSFVELLNLEKAPQRIEAYDISNISGTDTVGGMVVFTHGRPDKKAYRRFRIQSVEGQDDYASMQEMIFRRMERGIKEQKEGLEGSKSAFLPFPDLFCIDGGQAHVDAVKSILHMYPELSFEVCGLVKDQHHTLRGIIYQDKEYRFDKGTPASKFLTEISEEVHRYALGYHQSLRKKTMLHSELGSIPGIGPKRLKNLLMTFKNAENIKNATVKELEAVPGMNRKVAEAVVAYYREGASSEDTAKTI